MGLYWVSLRGYLRYCFMFCCALFIILWHMENPGHRDYLHFKVRMLHWPAFVIVWSHLHVNSP
ncbi:hypothetical protein BDV37DRAFT_96639 [Aspergillus pseudonomiae]|uniref:Uncharacterized protein n=1 Tax=Aspergillus pseudonomiae TaxID=1506151 RepID=A0A5N7CRR8_9EURO|nr:uncharacterized protein BDV37DRAFT_96639 [Aspergillus pseudonomiae]KAE8396825.1 hypothetical protein BDV37DRAFT_96639 [Aspergillus pseudonomiae]